MSKPSTVPFISGVADREVLPVEGVGGPPPRLLKVFQMDLWTIIPYYTSYLSEALTKEGFDVTLGSITYRLDLDCFRRHGIANDPGLLDLVGRYRIRSSLLRRGLKFIESCINLLALAVRFFFRRPDVLHVQYLQMVEWRVPFDVWFCRFAQWLGCKLVYTVHNILPHMPVPSADRHRRTYGNLYRRPDALICHTRESQRLLVEEYGVDPRRIWLIPHGPMFHDMHRPTVGEARARLELQRGECAVLVQGFIAPYKGLNFLLDAWSLVHRQRSGVRLLVAGTGREQWLKELQDRVKTLGITSSVRLDFRFVPAEQLPALFQAADILVYPYNEITGSGALMTGLSFQKPIVATDLPAFREVLRDGISALLAPYGDVEQFAAALLRLIDDPALRDRLASRAAQIPESWSSIARITRACYESVLGWRATV